MAQSPSMEATLPALAMLEFDSVADGIATADAMIKRSPIALLKLGTVQPGHYLALIGGSVAAVEESYKEGVAIGAGSLIDSVFLPDVHEEVYAASLGRRIQLEHETLGVLETRGPAALLRAADAAVKGAAVHIAEIRLADELGGHAFLLFDGSLPDVGAALEIAGSRLEAGQIRCMTQMPRLDEDLRSLLNLGTRFGPCAPLTPSGAEMLEIADGGQDDASR